MAQVSAQRAGKMIPLPVGIALAVLFNVAMVLVVIWPGWATPHDRSDLPLFLVFMSLLWVAGDVLVPIVYLGGFRSNAQPDEPLAPLATRLSRRLAEEVAGEGAGWVQATYQAWGLERLAMVEPEAPGLTDAVAPLTALLRCGTPAECRRSAARALGAIGDQRSVRPLVDALDDGDPDVVLTAAVSLAQLGDARGYDVLLSAAGRRTDPGAGGERMFQCMAPTDAFEAEPSMLNIQLVERPAAEVAFDALVTLVPRVEDRLVGAMTDPDPGIWLAAAAALDLAGWTPDTHGLKVRHQLASGGWDAVEVLNDPADLLDDDAELVRWVAAELRRTGNPASLRERGQEAVPALVEILATRDHTRAREAARVLTEELHWTPTTPDERVRYAISQRDRAEIERLARDGVGVDLFAALMTEGPVTHSQALVGLIAAGDVRAVPYLEELYGPAKAEYDEAWGNDEYVEQHAALLDIDEEKWFRDAVDSRRKSARGGLEFIEGALHDLGAR
jgi:HEAT repeat protein